ncbi:enoyl-CoA hydratase/carnithine racemase [Bradyrhizobium sp. AZCC 1693]
MGLVNRLVPSGQALAEALAMAHKLSTLPQAAMRSDRMSCYEQWPLAVRDALLNEFQHGMATIKSREMIGGLQRFASGD